jgi:hypothetical protein
MGGNQNPTVTFGHHDRRSIGLVSLARSTADVVPAQFLNVRTAHESVPRQQQHRYEDRIN